MHNSWGTKTMNDRYNEIFSKEKYTYANQKYRWIDKQAFNEYYSQICKRINPSLVENILDICCGTGQFAVNMASAIPKAKVVALDSSSTQIEALKSIIETNNIGNVFPLESRFEDYDTEKRFDVITCSEAVHLFADFSTFARKTSELLRPSGILVIRTPSPAQLMERKIYDFFPRCRYINLLNCKGPELIETAFSLYGLHILDAYIVDESKTYDKEELLDAFKSKLFSTLSLIPEHEFEEGLKGLEHMLANKDRYYYDFHMTSYIIGRWVQNHG